MYGGKEYSVLGDQKESYCGQCVEKEKKMEVK